MLKQFFKRFSGSHYRKYEKKCAPIIAKINQIEVELQSLSEAELKSKTQEFMERFNQGEALEDLLPEAFAVVKNASRRMSGQTLDVCGHDLKWEMVHYDVQLLGGIALHEKRIAEMATGEGKTLVSTCPLYLNALSGRNCQLVTVNDYLARRDSEWMGSLFKYLGLSVGCIQNGMSPADRSEMYGRNITYGTASEFGFDYLRDNGMASRKEDQVQRDHFFCIIDEVDSILVDEARTPLIISGPMQEDTPLPFKSVKPLVQSLVRKQQTLCNELITEAKQGLEDSSISEEKRAACINNLFKVKLGMPKHKQLLRMVEDADIRRELEEADLELSSDFKKDERYKLKESLYFIIDEKQGQADLTEIGRVLMSPDDPDAFMLPDLPTQFVEIDKVAELTAEEKQKAKHDAEEKYQFTSERIHCIGQLLRAYSLFERDKEYVVQSGKVNIVDQNTGRVMAGRRWSDGLHQAIEAKENCAIEKETKTYATVTIQNYFRMYEKLAGMTGTAETEASEFNEIYGLSVMVIPTHKPNIREDLKDAVYKTRREKFNAVIQAISEIHKSGQPVLVGTASVETSELVSRMLKRSNIIHSVLNAKFHAQEAEIVTRAGQKGAVTIATNMAGRGTDIKLGEGVLELGGLFVLGTERHESRRVDRQLRGRCGRQGDAGMSKFYVSFEDDLMRLFANGPGMSAVLGQFKEGEPIESGLLSATIQNAQKKVEQQNFSIRKRLLQFDDVLNTQREVIYSIRNEAITSDKPRDVVLEMVSEEIEERLESLAANKNPEELTAFTNWVNAYFPLNISEEIIKDSNTEASLKLILEAINKAYQERETYEDVESLKGLERYILIRAIDRRWQDHLTEMEELRRSVSLRSYGQKDPLSEYKSEAFGFFEELMASFRTEICTAIFRTATNQSAFEKMFSKMGLNVEEAGPGKGAGNASALAGAVAQEQAQAGVAAPNKKEVQLPKVEPIRRELPKIGRNDTVTIVKNGEEKQMKYKKAEALIENEGWALAPSKS